MRNGQRVDGPVLLADGDVIEVAYAKLRFTTTPPVGVPVAPLRDPSNETSRRNPTLATGKISVVPSSESTATRRTTTALIVVAMVAAAAWWWFR
jgi:hypothetical protein